MFKQYLSAVLFLIALFVVSPGIASALEPFVIDDFENGLGRWYGSGGGGAQNGIIEETADAHDGKTAMRIILPEGDAGWTLIQSQKEGETRYVALKDMGYEAFRFWIKAIKGIDKDEVLQLQLLGIGAHSTDNRWTYNFNVPLGNWTEMVIPFKDLKLWNQEKREFKIEYLDYPGFYRAKTPWPQMEFIVDQFEVGLIVEPIAAVQPSDKLSLTWGQIKGQ